MTETRLDREERHEGRRPLAYDDATGETIKPGYTMVGNATIGVGTLIGPGGGLTSAEIDLLFHNRDEIAAHFVDNNLPIKTPLPVLARDVLIEMAFQLGGGGLLKFHHMLAALDIGDYVGAGDEILNSEIKHGRAMELADLMRSCAAAA